MSRTRKDRPYWVIANESNIVSHNHLLFGKEVLGRSYVKDESGKPILEEVTRTRRVFNYDHAAAVGVSYAHASRNMLKYYYLFEEEDFVITRPKTVYVTRFVYQDECTAGDKSKRDNDDLPCYRVPPHRGYRERFHRDLRDAYYASDRTAKKSVLSHMAKEWNSGEDVSESEDAVVDITHQHRHGVLWWW